MEGETQQFIKFTYNTGAKKINAYIKMNSPTYHFLMKEIEFILFEQFKLSRCEIRAYWIDKDGDKIDIFNQLDYDSFMAKSANRLHLQIVPNDMAAETDDALDSTKSTVTSADLASNETKIPPASGSYVSAAHYKVQCDSCHMLPIMGFRYKCIQCKDYDLCENCEAKHIHYDHMMIRMPTNNCRSFVKSLITGSTPEQRHADSHAPKSESGENAEQSSQKNYKESFYGRKHRRRHHRANFFSSLYEMMNDLAEGGGAAAAAHAMGESSTKTKTTSTGPEEKPKTTTFNATKFENMENSSAAAAAAAAAATAANISAQKVHEIAAKIAHETALKAVKNFTENISDSRSTSTAKDDKKEKEATKENVDTAPLPRFDSETSPSLESLVPFLDPQLIKTGAQILNNFSDMFAKMLDPVENFESTNNSINSNLCENSKTSNKSSVSSNLNSLEDDKKFDEEKSIEEKHNEEKIEKSKETGSDASSHVEIYDLGSDSENDSVSEPFVKIYAPNIGNVPTFVQLSADLKAHIDQEAEKASVKTVETTTEAVENVNKAPTSITSTTTTATDPVVTNISITTTTLNSTAPNKSEEKRAVPVYHPDPRINNAVIAMMSMGFSNEGAWLTQLLESVNGNIPEALDLMTAAQLGGEH